MNKKRMKEILFNTGHDYKYWSKARWFYNIADYLLWTLAIFTLLNLSLLNIRSYMATRTFLPSDIFMMYLIWIGIILLLATLMETLNERLQESE